MPDQIIFRGAYIRHLDVRQSPEGEAVFVRAHIACDFSDPVIEAMRWEDLPEGFSQASLKGELAAQTMTMKPSSRELDKHAFDLPIHEARDFQVVSLKQDDDKPDKRELRFVVRSADHKATRVLDDYLRTIGKGKGQLRISYTGGQESLDIPDDKQEELPLKGDAAAEHEERPRGRKKVN
jgi:hypothetical protein